MISKDQFTILDEPAVIKRFHGAVEGLKEQCKWRGTPPKADGKPPVKISAIGGGGWQYGVYRGVLYLFNSVFHGSKLGVSSVYDTVYTWHPDQLTWVCENASNL